MRDKLRILYATGRYSPLDHDAGSGEDFNLYHAFSREDCTIRIVGPLDETPSLIEQLYRRIHFLVSRKRPAKYSMALLKTNARAITDELREHPADVLFSHNLSPFVKLKTDLPIVLLMDAPLLGTEIQWPLFSKIEFRRMVTWEQAVLKKCTRIITRSEWARDILIQQNHVPAEKIVILQAASSLPERVIPARVDSEDSDFSTLKLLLVGRVYQLKGIDIAIDVVEKLNRLGIRTELRIVGMNGENTQHVRFMDRFHKADEKQLADYAEQYRWAHFLLHPARYDSAPIVTAEAAAFGVPTISNAVGGIATTVKSGVSGVVLPMRAPADEYVRVFQYYVNNPQEYDALRRSTRNRYEKELNWNVVGHQVFNVLKEVGHPQFTKREKIRILYASFRYDPLNRDAGSGVDFNLRDEFLRQGVEVNIVGPIKDQPSWFEALYKKAHRLFSKKLTAKFSLAYLRSCGRELDRVAAELHPDLIFTHNLIPLVFCKTKIPIIYKSDAILKNMHNQWPTYSKLELSRMLNWERIALNKSEVVITASRWAMQSLENNYCITKEKILLLPIPSSLPHDVVPKQIKQHSINREEIHILSVAKNYHLKGIDIALEVIKILNQKGYNIKFRIVGQTGINTDNVEYIGFLHKGDPKQLAKYTDQYKWADFLLHPARYEAAGIVCGEAAAFGIPTITNSIGGLATTVEDGVSGVVLPVGSKPDEYTKVIEYYINHDEEYRKLCISTRNRYEKELNWTKAVNRIVARMEQILDSRM